VPTEMSDERVQRNEDSYCADYIEALLTAPETAATVLAERIARLYAEGRFAHWGAEKDQDFPVEDMEKILAVDCFDFVMRGTRQESSGLMYVDVERQDDYLL